MKKKTELFCSEVPCRTGSPSAQPARQGPHGNQREVPAQRPESRCRAPLAPDPAAWTRRLLPLLLVLAVPASLRAQSYTDSYGLWYYTATSGAATLSAHSGPLNGAVVLPNEVNGLPVVSIGDNAFVGQNNLTSVMIGTNVAYIGYDAFGYCENLTSVTIPNSVTTIGKGAFAGCTNLTTVTIPNGAVGEGAFAGCFSLTNATIGNGVTSLGEEAFTYDHRLASVTIGDSLTNIGFNSFAFCGALATVTLGRSVGTIPTAAFYSCSNLTSVYCQGDAPNLGDGVFGYGFDEGPWVPDPTTIYYLPGATGWSNTFGGLPTVLWNPQVQAGSYGVRSNQFGFNVTGTSNLVVVIEAATNLVNPTWQPLQTNTLNGLPLYFRDPQWSNYAGRFYRVTWP